MKMTITFNDPPSTSEIERFENTIDFQVPLEYLNFIKSSNGAIIHLEDYDIELWKIGELIDLNVEYEVLDCAPDFFIIGSDGSGTAFAIKKNFQEAFALPFIGMSNETASLADFQFSDLLNS